MPRDLTKFPKIVRMGGTTLMCWAIAAYVYVDVYLFMTANRIEETFGRRNEVPSA